MTSDPSLLEAALIGYQLQRDRIDKAIAELRAKINSKASLESPAEEQGAKRKISAAGRKRMAAAQRKRRATYRKQHGK